MRRGGKGRSYPRLVFTLNWSSRSRAGAAGMSIAATSGAVGPMATVAVGAVFEEGVTAEAGEEGCTRGQ